MASNNSAKANSICSIQNSIEPVASAAAVSGTWVLASAAYQWLAIVNAGTVGTSVDAKIEQATDSSGSSVKDLSGSSITQLVAAGTAAIQFRQNQLDTANGFDYVRLTITKVGATTVAGGVLLALSSMYEPLANVATVDEVITVA